MVCSVVTFPESAYWWHTVHTVHTVCLSELDFFIRKNTKNNTDGEAQAQAATLPPDSDGFRPVEGGRRFILSQTLPFWCLIFPKLTAPSFFMAEEVPAQHLTLEARTPPRKNRPGR